MNQRLHNLSTSEHITNISSLAPEVYIVQHTLLFKAGDAGKMNPTLTFITFYILTDVAVDYHNMIFSIIHQTIRMKDSNYKHAYNLSFGNLIEHILINKYPGYPFTEYDVNYYPRPFMTANFTRHDWHRQIGRPMAPTSVQGKLSRLSIAVE